MKPVRFELQVYESGDGKRPFDLWLDRLRDKTVVARILTRLDRVEQGQWGDTKALGGGISELRFAFGPGYRVYYARYGAQIVVLLAGGDKASQERDIRLARSCFEDFRRRSDAKTR